MKHSRNEEAPHMQEAPTHSNTIKKAESADATSPVGLADQTSPANPADFNSYEGCRQCGECCRIRIVAVKPEEAERIRNYIRDNGIVPRDNGPECCPLLDADMRCMVWPVRSQTCRLHSCQKTRREILAEHPEIEREPDRPWLDMRAAWLEGDFRDPRFI